MSRKFITNIVVASLLSQLTWVNLSCQPAEAARFVDLSGNWSEKYVNALSDKGIISAESDGKFRPSDPVTRAVLASWMVKALGLENQPVSSTPSFPDVKPTDSYYKAVEIIRQNNYIAGYPDGFRPKQNIQRGEVITILARALNSPALDDGSITTELSKFSDSSKIPDWARSGIAQASKAGIIINNPNSSVVNAATIATRGDTAALISKLTDYLTQKQIDNATARATQDAPPQQAVAPPANPAGYPIPVSYAGVPLVAQAPPTYPPPQQPYAQQPPPSYQGQVYQQQGYQGAAQQAPFAAPGAYVAPQGPPPGAYPLQGQYAQPAYGAPPTTLQGRVVVVGAGTKFNAALKNTLNSGSTQPGEQVEATLSSPVYSGGVEVVPAGSKLIGSVTSVVSAARFKFGANGKIDIKFTAVETPDGRRFPLSASVDDTQVKLVGGSTMGRVGKGALTAGIGAGSGAALGTALGAIVGGTSGSRSVGKATGMGAVFGTAIGGGIGLVGAGVRKGSEVSLPAGQQLPVQLDESLQISAGAPAYQPPAYQPQPYPQQPAYGAPPQYGAPYQPPPVQQPMTGGFYPQ